jgi:hypothetical protein
MLQRSMARGASPTGGILPVVKDDKFVGRCFEIADPSSRSRAELAREVLLPRSSSGAGEAPTGHLSGRAAMLQRWARRGQMIRFTGALREEVASKST